MFKKIFLGVVLNGLALFIVTFLLTDIHYTGGIRFFIIGGLIIGILNTFVRPLMKIFSLPLLFLTFGLFSWIINIFIFWLTMKAVNGISISSVSVMISSAVTYILAALFFALCNWFLHIFIPNK